jgi:hypothetical protein
MSQHDSIDFGNRPPTGSAAPPRRGELAFASIFEKLSSSAIGSAVGATKSPASCPFHLLLCGSVPLWCASNSPASCPFHALLNAPDHCRNRLTFTLSLSDRHFSQAVEIQTHRLNGSNLIKPKILSGRGHGRRPVLRAAAAPVWNWATCRPVPKRGRVRALHMAPPATFAWHLLPHAPKTPHRQPYYFFLPRHPPSSILAVRPAAVCARKPLPCRLNFRSLFEPRPYEKTCG